MSEFSLSENINLTVTARFISKGNDAPVTGEPYVVRLYDKDIFEDDFLGESKLDEDGKANISFTHASFSNWDTDDKPDFYFVVFKNKNQIFKSKVMQDLDIEVIQNFKMGQGEIIDLGTFLITA